ncbi:MAG TPA: VanW family protein, partial [Rubrobacter sp.]|nr:VanW family protein [Rubrobacter sp.]
GKTPEEAREILERRHPAARGEIELSGTGETFAVSTDELGVRFDVEKTVERAYAVGRRGGVLERLAWRMRSFFGVSVPAEVVYRPEAARAAVARIAPRANREPREASATVSGSRVEVKESAEGYSLDVPATVETVDRALESLAGEAEMAGEVLEPGVNTGEAEAAAEEVRGALSSPLVLRAEGRSWTLSPEDVGSALTFTEKDGELRVSLDRNDLKDRMAAVYADLVVEPVEAGYAVGSGATPTIETTPGREGRRVEEEELFGTIGRNLFRGRHEYDVPVVTDGPDLSTAEARRLKPTRLLGSYRTNYAVVSDTGARVENLGISSGAVNGTLLAPGQVFSMNAHVSGLDYNESKVIVGGQETTADGGGLCQVTSTLYNAANFAGLDVIERTPHSAQLPYIRPGMDATVWWGGPGMADDLDMKFRNTTDGYLLLREYVAEDGYVYAEIWGRPNGTEVKMRSKPTYLGEDGSEWVTYQTVEKNGRVVFDGVLHKDAYEPLVDTHGDPIPPPDVPVAPVTP